MTTLKLIEYGLLALGMLASTVGVFVAQAWAYDDEWRRRWH